MSVLTERRGSVLVVTLNRPEARNALDPATSEGISLAMQELDESPDLAVGILTGAGPAFCAGMDLKAFLTQNGQRPASRTRGSITQHPPSKPLIAAVEGWAVAGGFELVLACDIVVAGRSARFGVPEVKRSLVASGGAALHLTSRIPRPLAMELLLTGEPISAERAAEIGLVNHVVEDGEAVSSAMDIAAVIARNGPLAVEATKRIAFLAGDWTTENRWAMQKAYVDPVRSSADAREGAAAFVEKRPAVWSRS